MSDTSANQPPVEDSGDTIKIPREAPSPPAGEIPPGPNGTFNAMTGGNGTSTGNQNQTFTAADIEKARKEEKDKLYQRLESQEAELRAIREAREAETTAQTKAREKAEAEARKQAESELDAKALLEQRQTEWEQRFQSMQQEISQRDAILDQERRFAQLATYRQRRLMEEADNILPELLDLASGNTEEEIELNLASLRERTERILGNVTAAQQQQRQQAKGVPVTAPPVGPMDNDPTYETVSADDIRNMDIATYAKYRERLLGSAGHSNNNRGLYG